MAVVVIGLSPNGNFAPLRQALTQGGLHAERLQSIDPSDVASPLTHGLAGSGLLEPDGGTRVPGISNGLQTAAFSDDDPQVSLLNDLGLSESAMGIYQEALERGRFVVAYRANPADADRAEEAFRTAGVLNVRRY